VPVVAKAKPDGSAYLEAERKSSPHLATALKAIEIDRRRTSAGYPFKTFEEMALRHAGQDLAYQGSSGQGRGYPG